MNATTLWPHVANLWQKQPAHFVGFYFLMYAASGISLALLLVSLNRYLAYGALALLIAILATNHLAKDLLELKAVNPDIAEWLLSETGEAPAAVREFTGPFMRSLAFSVVTLLPFAFIVRLGRRRFRRRLPRRAAVALGALALYGMSGMILQRYYSPYIPIESNLLVYAANSALEPNPPVLPLDLRPVHPALATKIVLVVDETLTYGAYVEQLRPYWAKWNSVDFGEAASLGNCSAPSNSMLRWGFRAQSMLERKDPRLVPTVWSYARATGYETYLIDGQRRGAYQNFMRGEEAALIDRYFGVDRGNDTDRAIAERLRELLLAPGRRFVYVNKRGHHFPYADRYPPERFPAARTREQQYAAAVAYSTRDFLDVALRGVPLENVLILYTSDHGERLDGGGRAPHCNSAPVWQEFSVPLLLLTGNSPLAERAASAAGVLRDRAGHEQIFATLLYAMGYDLRAAEDLYGSSLLSTSVPRRYFHVATNPIPSDRRRKPLVKEFDHFPYRDAETSPALGMR